MIPESMKIKEWLECFPEADQGFPILLFITVLRRTPEQVEIRFQGLIIAHLHLDKGQAIRLCPHRGLLEERSEPHAVINRPFTHFPDLHTC